MVKRNSFRKQSTLRNKKKSIKITKGGRTNTHRSPSIPTHTPQLLTPHPRSPSPSPPSTRTPSRTQRGPPRGPPRGPAQGGRKSRKSKRTRK